MSSAVHTSHPHESAHLHVAGEASYIDDIPEIAGTLHCALGMSSEAHAEIVAIDLSAVLALPGVVAVLRAEDIPGVNDCGPILHDDPILAEGKVMYLGQPLFAVVATTRQIARQAARLGKVKYRPLPALLTAREAHAAKSYVMPPLQLSRGDPASAIANAPHRLQGQFEVGGQEQFYLEGQIAYVVPKEDHGFHVYSSTQHPTEMQQLVCHCLNLRQHQVTVEMRRMGGGFGGKESQSAIFCAIAALAAAKLKRPVKLRPDRDDDMLITGKRHDFAYDYQVGFDEEGRLLGVMVEMLARAGFSTDLTPPVATRALCHFDNAYYLQDVDIKVFMPRTNTQSNTAFRGFGGPQGAIAIEFILDEIARTLGRDPLDVRLLNLYAEAPRNLTPYQQPVEDNVFPELLPRLLQSSNYRARRQAVAEFNAREPVLKKGLYLTPVKFGISFNVKHFNQAGALVHLYVDGSVLVNHGGAEMGQGLNTKVAQVVANELGVDLAQVRSSAADTSKVANTSATAASTGSDLNGKAAEDAARQIRLRLAGLAASLWGCQPEQVRFSNGQVSATGESMPLQALVELAYKERIQLWSDGFYKTPGLSWDPATLTGKPFFYYAYGAAVAEVVIDTLTGEWKLLRADLLHDVGSSLNPAIDQGQIEGGFIQGMGWLTTEELCWNDKGLLTTHAPSTYKIPAVNDSPAEFHTELFSVPNRSETILKSKAVGEPPLLLGFAVYFALRDAIANARGDGKGGLRRAPASCEAILKAICSKSV